MRYTANKNPDCRKQITDITGIQITRTPDNSIRIHSLAAWAPKGAGGYATTHLLT